VAILEKPNDVIRTARLLLRPPREGDEARIFELFAHWEVIRFLSSPPWPYAPGAGP
jgi:RimJ/RimL family protein N-acetyltransferase